MSKRPVSKKIAFGIKSLAIPVVLTQVIACSAGEGSSDEATTTRNDSLYGYDGATLWSGPVPMCFVNAPRNCRDTDPATCDNNVPDANRPVSSAQDYSDAKGDIVDALAETWEAFSSITFDNKGDCPANVATSHPEWLVLTLRNDGWGGFCGMGAGVDCEFGINDKGRIQDVVVHEVGHALGIQHEHARDDVQACDKVEARLDACNQCLSNAPCRTTDSVWPPRECFCPTLAIQNLCLDKTESAVHRMSDADIGVAEGIVWNYEGGPGNTLTKYDPSSIMNYCSSVADGGYRKFDNNNPMLSDWWLTDLDRVGIEILYPTGRTLKLACIDGPCFNVGSGVVALSGGRFSHEWQAKGGYARMTSTSPVYGLTKEPYFKATDFSDGATVSGNVWGGKDDNAQSISGTVSKSASLFTAVLASVM